MTLFDPEDISEPRGPERLARASDPPTSHLAATRMIPKIGTRKREVFDALVTAPGEGWVDGWDIASPWCGGSEGLRRLRELESEDGLLVERRPSGCGTGWSYRIAR